MTQPVGMVFFVLSRVCKVLFVQCVGATLPFLVPLIGALLLLIFIPQLVLWLPELLYG
ncbi:TRAP transporter large permease subunit [Shimia sp. R9_1]|uniref:TRAP transporter large permease subunit n=1 Tax=Shimia sp. R9_1 TaxID=2821111 RepID=UPI0032AF7820